MFEDYMKKDLSKEDFKKYTKILKTISKMTPKKLEHWIKDKIKRYYLSIGLTTKISESLSDEAISDLNSILLYIEELDGKKKAKGFFSSMIGIMVLSDMMNNVISPLEIGTLSYLNCSKEIEDYKKGKERNSLSYIK